MSMFRSLASRYRLRDLHLLGHHDQTASRLPGLSILDQGRHFSVDHRARWAFGSLLTLILPFWNKEWKNLLRLEGEVEKVAGVVETAAEVMENVATVAERVSSEVAERLPVDGKLKDAALLVERLSKEAVEEAKLARDIIHKADELKQEAEMFLHPGAEPEKIVGSRR